MGGNHSFVYGEFAKAGLTVGGYAPVDVNGNTEAINSFGENRIGRPDKSNKEVFKTTKMPLKTRHSLSLSLFPSLL